MPTDRADLTTEIKAPCDTVLAAIRDIASQPDWIPEVEEAEVLEVYQDGLPATARFTASAGGGTDEFTLSYDHADDSMSWTMVESRLLDGQEGRFTVRPLAPDRTGVTYDLTIEHNLALPGFMRNRIIKRLVSGTLEGLSQHLES